MTIPSPTALLLNAIQIHRDGVAVNISAETDRLMTSDVSARLESEQIERHSVFGSVIWGGRTEK